eukprot:15473869-Alexandrium_andersonii.AAC.1
MEHGPCENVVAWQLSPLLLARALVGSFWGRPRDQLASANAEVAICSSTLALVHLTQLDRTTCCDEPPLRPLAKTRKEFSVQLATTTHDACLQSSRSSCCTLAPPSVRVHVLSCFRAWWVWRATQPHQRFLNPVCLRIDSQRMPKTLEANFTATCIGPGFTS